jgi:hypothetical protein
MLAELLELDQQTRAKRNPQSFQQKQRRAQLARELHAFALERQRAEWSGDGEQRQDPRAKVRLRVQLVGGPHPVELESDSLAIGGMSLMLPFLPHRSDRLHLRLVPPPPDEPVAVDGEIIWTNAARHRVGVRFCDVSEDARALLERLIYSDLVTR